MLELQLGWWLDQQKKTNPTLNQCLETLTTQSIINSQKILLPQLHLPLTTASILNPLFYKLLSQSKLSPKQKHLIVLTHAILRCPDMRAEVDWEATNSMPASIWHKSGYLESCLDVLVKCLFITKNVGGLISLEDVLESYGVLADKYERIVNQYKLVCQGIHLEDVELGSGLAEDDFTDLLEILITAFKPAVGTYSGSRRLGYLFKGYTQGTIAHKKCLMSYYNEKPNFIFVTKLVIDSTSQKATILGCNYIRDDVLLSTYGCLPTLSKQSFGECQVEFHQISSAIFAHLSKYDGLQMNIFENENDCSVQANSQLNAITIQCKKDKQKQITDKFSKVLTDISDMFKKQTKSFMQSPLLKVLIGSGGEISQLVPWSNSKKNQIMEIALLKNLAPQVGIEELKELFDEFIQLKHIQMVPKQNRNEALITFYSAQDYTKFYQIFSGCVYYYEPMIIQPYIEQVRVFNNEECLLFEWNIWKSIGEALIEFQNNQYAKNAIINLKNLAGPKASVQVKSNMIFVERLDQSVDEKDLAAWVSGNGKIKNIEIRRFNKNSNESEDVSISSIIKQAFPKENIVCHPGRIEKGKNGARSCKINVPNKNQMNEIFFVLNEGKGILGNGKLYVSPLFSYPIKLPEPDQSYVQVYLDIIEDLSKELGRIDPLKTEIIKEPLNWTMIISTNSDEEMKVVKSTLPQRLKGTTLKTKQSSLLFTEIAQRNFESLQKRMPIKIIPDIIQKKIKVLCRPSLCQILQKEVNTLIEQSFCYKMPLYQKAYVYLQANIGEIVGQEIKCGLKYNFQPINKNLNLEANLLILEKARDKINKSLAALKSKAKEDSMGSEELCGLCCQEFSHPFKLQGCGHFFCYDCLQASIKFALNDITLYPMKCPQCSQKIWISDLNCLIQQKEWSTIIKNSVNHFIFRHPGQYMYCLTAGCTFICNIKYKSSYSCPDCKKGYCLQCNNNIHPNMTCHQARYGSDRLFSQYMLNAGGRICANKMCKAPIERISGCFKVQCSRCKKCMCFKCPANSMTAYDTPEETYNHLNRAHGGCF